MTKEAIDSRGIMMQPRSTRQDYARYARPGVAAKLSALGLDIEYTSAEGNYLRYQSGAHEISVLDALGGYGANIFGHLHPMLTAVLKRCLDQKVPYLAQLSIRPNVARVSKALNDILQARTNHQWVSLIYNTGADAVEASLKHAEMCRLHRLQAVLTEIEKRTLRLKQDAQRNPDIMHPEWRKQAAAQLGLSVDGYSDEELFTAILERQFDVIEKPSLCLALQRGYHGKSNGALHLTSSEKYRAPFKGLAHRTQFIKPEDTASLEEAIAEAVIALPEWVIEAGKWNLTTRPFTNVSALYVEPLQGEGGIYPLSERFLAACRACADEHGFQLVFDEIQSGMGRTGRFLYSEHVKIWADVYLLSKSLGGGLSKLSAVCIQQPHYLPDFDELHSSTFAEDDHSAAVALQALQMVTEDTSLMKNADEQGAYLKSELAKVAEDYPDVIADVRGVGLFLGVEFASQTDSEFFILRVLSEQKLLGYLVTGCLLYEHQVRVASTLADNFVLRIEPSFYIERAECDQIVAAIRQVAHLMRHGDVYGLAKYLVGRVGEYGQSKARSFIGQGNGRIAPLTEGATGVTFTTNIVDVNVMTQVEPSLALFEPNELQALCDRIFPVLEPTVLSCQPIESPCGKRLDFHTKVVMYDTDQALALLQNQHNNSMVDDLRGALKVAEKQGHTTLGLGAYTSICTVNGTALNSDSVCITTGNALTVAAGVESLINEACTQKINLSQSRIGIVGAVGNIASMYSQLLAQRVPRVVLIGRNKSDVRLSKLVALLYVEAAKRLQRDATDSAGIATAIKSSRAFRDFAQVDLGKRKNAQAWVQAIQQELGEDAPVTVSDSLESLQGCELVLCASNASNPIVFPHHLATDTPVIVCDISVPVDVSKEVVEQCPNVTVLAGGLFELPQNPDLEWVGFTELGTGEAYACMTETMLLAFEGQRHHSSYGLITEAQVKHVSGLAKKYGFKVKAKHLSPQHQPI